jgi:hypothetical protein
VYEYVVPVNFAPSPEDSILHSFRDVVSFTKKHPTYVSYQKNYRNTMYQGETLMAFPRLAAKPPAPPEVPESIAQDFNEAAAVLPISAQASAALSRRCLQHVLSERSVSTSSNLSTAIDAALASGLPSQLAENLDAIRNIGNFAAHVQKAENSGEVVPVEPEEAEWNLEVLELLFDFYYVQPAVAAARRSALNVKLAEAGKGPMKEPPGAA